MYLALDKVRLLKIDILRRGAKRHTDPSHNSRLEEHAPDLLMPETKLIVQTTNRVATALMHSRSLVQTRQVMLAAFKRNSIEARGKPAAKQQQAATSESAVYLGQRMSGIYDAAMNQTVAINHILETMTAQPKSQDFYHLVSMIQQTSVAQQAALFALHQSEGA